MSDRELVYRISVHGQAEARSAIRSVVQEANRVAREEARAAQEAERAKTVARRTGSADRRKVADDEAAHAARVAKANLALEKNNAKERVREAKDVQKATTRAEAETSKFLFSEWQKRQREEKRLSDQRVRDAKKEADEIAKFKLQAETNTSRHIMQERQRMQRQAERDARQFARDRAFEERRLLKSIGTGFAEGGMNALRYTAGMASRGVREVASGLGMERGFDVADIVRERMSMSRMARSVAIEARQAGGQFGGVSESEIMSKAASVARKTGFTQEELAKAVDAYSEKGSGAQGVQDLEAIAMQAKAMGADPASIARLRANLGLKGMNSQQQDQFISRMHFVGKTGVFRASDLAAQSEMMLASFGPDIVKGGNDFLGFANEVRQSTGSGAMARTAFDSALDALDRKRAHIEGTGGYKRNGKWVQGLGVKYEDENGEARSKVDIIKDIIAATGGDKTRLAEFFDPSRGGKAIETLVDAFNGKNSRVAGMSGRAAMDKLLEGDESLKNANMGELMIDANKAVAESSNQVAVHMEELRQKIAEKLMPVIDKLIAKLPDIVDKLGKGLDYIVENPGKALALGAGGAAIEKMLENVVPGAARYIAGRFTNTVPGSVGGKVGSVVGALTQAAAQPVFVTNWPGGGGIPGVPGTTPGGGVPGETPTTPTPGGKLGKTLGKLGIWAAVLETAWEGGNWASDKIAELQGNQRDASGSFDYLQAGAGRQGFRVNGRKANAADMVELALGRRENQERREGIASMLDQNMYNAMLPDIAGYGPLSNEEASLRKERRGAMLMMTGKDPGNSAYTDLMDPGFAGASARGRPGVADTAPNMTKLATAIDDTTKAIEDLGKKAKAASRDMSSYKVGPVL